MSDWLRNANNRTVPALKARPVDLLASTRPRRSRCRRWRHRSGWCSGSRLPRDYYVRVNGND
jgi:hypothetical protein